MSIIKTIRSLFKSSELPERTSHEFGRWTGDIDMSDNAAPYRREHILELRNGARDDMAHVKQDISRRVYTCKSKDDAFLMEMKVSLDRSKETIAQVDEEILSIINTFPANRPCTAYVIAKEIGIPQSLVLDCLVKYRTFSSLDSISEHVGMEYSVWRDKFGLSYK